MGTRSIILITGHGPTYRLYKHYDGYPIGNLPIIDRALERATRLNTIARERFKSKQESIKTATLAALIVGEAATENGFGAIIEHENSDAFSPVDFGNQWDLEWIYHIDTERQTLHIYGGGYSKDCGPQKHVENGMVDPLISVADDDKELREHVAIHVRDIEAWSFKVNPKPVAPAPNNVVKLALKEPFKTRKTAPKRKGSRLQPWQTK